MTDLWLRLNPFTPTHEKRDSTPAWHLFPAAWPSGTKKRRLLIRLQLFCSGNEPNTSHFRTPRAFTFCWRQQVRFIGVGWKPRHSGKHEHLCGRGRHWLFPSLFNMTLFAIEVGSLFHTHSWDVNNNNNNKEKKMSSVTQFICMQLHFQFSQLLLQCHQRK